MAATRNKGINLVRLAVVLIPAAIFIGFYVAGLRHRAAQGPPIKPPAHTVAVGTAVSLGGYSFQAGRPLFTQTLKEPDNTVLAGPDQLFVILPIITTKHNQPAHPPGLTWQMVDNTGTAHPELQPKDLIIPPALAAAPGTAPSYMVFKVPASSRSPFLLLTSPWGQAAWRLSRSA